MLWDEGDVNVGEWGRVMRVKGGLEVLVLVFDGVDWLFALCLPACTMWSFMFASSSRTGDPERK